ncbi:MAG: Capsular exopolysaccharide family [Chthoniobacteraceae bacterium]|nr:Capsular exopolysaccharide family [Chthoniobacteraceae bacterium]
MTTPATANPSVEPRAWAIEIREVRNTRLLEIGAYDRDAALAAKIANTIAEVYRENRSRDLQRTVDKTLSSAEAEVERQQQQADASAAEMARIREHDGIINPDPEHIDMSANAPKAVGGRSEYAEAKRRYLRHCQLLSAAEQKLTNTRIILADATKVSPVHIGKRQSLQ